MFKKVQEGSKKVPRRVKKGPEGSIKVKKFQLGFIGFN